jgi:hypothetical protein
MDMVSFVLLSVMAFLKKENIVQDCFCLKKNIGIGKEKMFLTKVLIVGGNDGLKIKSHAKYVGIKNPKDIIKMEILGIMNLKT